MIFRDNCNMDLDTNSMVAGGRVARPEGASNVVNLDAFKGLE